MGIDGSTIKRKKEKDIIRSKEDQDFLDRIFPKDEQREDNSKPIVKKQNRRKRQRSLSYGSLEK